MKKIILIVTTFLFTTLTFAQVQVGVPVYDENMLHQIKYQYQPGYDSDNLTPWIWYHVIDRNYIRNYEPNFDRSLAVGLTSIRTFNNVGKEYMTMDSLLLKKYSVYLDRALDISYYKVSDEVELMKHVFQTYNDSIMNSNFEKANEIANSLQELFDDSLDKINIIKDSHIENKIREEEYKNYVSEMDTIVRETKKLWKCIKVYKKRAIFN